MYYREETHPVPVEMTRGNVQLFRSMICHHVMSLQPLEYIFSLKGSSIRSFICIHISQIVVFSDIYVKERDDFTSCCFHFFRCMSNQVGY